MSNPIYLHFITPHYQFEMTLTERTDILHTYHFLVGDAATPCLEGFVNLESTNNRMKHSANTAHLSKIDALQKCSLDDISDEYMSTYSFGSELLDTIIFFINSQFPSVETISLNDTSYIPCIREEKDTVDLLTYSVALYKKTWYEDKMHAYIKPKEKYDAYRQQVERYGSKERKSRMHYVDILGLLQKGTEYARDYFAKNQEILEECFAKSETLPDFFKAISRLVPRKEKCQFFKNWLQSFIYSEVMIDRTWHVDLFPKLRIIQKENRRNRTRKQGGKHQNRLFLK